MRNARQVRRVRMSRRGWKMKNFVYENEAGHQVKRSKEGGGRVGEENNS